MTTSSVPPGIAGAAVLLALALLVGAGGSRSRLRALTAGPLTDPAPQPVLRPAWVLVGALALGAFAGVVSGPVAAVTVAVVGTVAGAAAARWTERSRPRGDDPPELASRWELLAVCLEAGMPVAPALAAAAAPLTGTTGVELRRVAGLLELGADPVDAWQSAEATPGLGPFARAAGRSAATGSALARTARAEAERIRAELVDAAQARAQRAAVLITGPLGLCFLPAFLVLGIAPVVIGLAGEALARW